MRGKLNYYPRAPELYGRYAVSGVYIRSRHSGKQNSERIYTLTALKGLKSIITFITVRYSKTFHSPSAHEISQHISHLGPIDEQAIFVITYL